MVRRKPKKTYYEEKQAFYESDRVLVMKQHYADSELLWWAGSVLTVWQNEVYFNGPLASIKYFYRVGFDHSGKHPHCTPPRNIFQTPLIIATRLYSPIIQALPRSCDDLEEFVHSEFESFKKRNGIVFRQNPQAFSRQK